MRLQPEKLKPDATQFSVGSATGIRQRGRDRRGSAFRVAGIDPDVDAHALVHSDTHFDTNQPGVSSVEEIRAIESQGCNQAPERVRTPSGWFEGVEGKHEGGKQKSSTNVPYGCSWSGAGPAGK